MGSRLELHALLTIIFPDIPIYFQPPNNAKMQYPCVVYNLSDRDEVYADNSLYRGTKKYTITIIDSDPDTTLPDNLDVVPMCSMDRRFENDGLYHNVYSVHY